MRQGLPVGTNNFDLVTLNLEFDLLILANNVWIVSARALIFHINIACDKIILLVLNLLTMIFYQFWYWHYFWKKNKILELPYFLWQDLSTGIKIFVLAILASLELAIIGGIVFHKHILFVFCQEKFVFCQEILGPYPSLNFFSPPLSPMK